MKKYFLLVFFCFIYVTNFSSADESGLVLPQTPRIGNFSLPGSEQIGPLISFGQSLIGRNQLQLGLSFGAMFGSQNNFTTDFSLSATWGILDYLAFEVFLPVSFRNGTSLHHLFPNLDIINYYSSGINDLLVQLEGMLYTWGDPTHFYTSTLVTAITVPLGSISKVPATGIGAVSFFVGTTFSYVDPIWYVFTSYGGSFSLAGKGFQAGAQFLYQAGVGTYIPSPKGSLIDWLIEIDGTYAWKNKVNGVPNPRSGSNIVWITPSLMFSLTQWSFQAGVGFPAIQQLNGNQPKSHVNMIFSMAYTPTSQWTT